jgi:hypothetical protein
MVWLWHTVRQDDTFLYRGGRVFHAGLSALVILACTADGGPVRWLLSWSPLRALGAISYGVYLYHWPIFVWVDAPVVVQLALAVGLAVVSYRYLEMPIRRGQLRVPVAVVPVAALLVVGTVVASTLDPPRPAAFSLTAAEPPVPSSVVEPAADAPRVALFGDSTALRTGFALKGWGWTNGLLDIRDGDADVGCPLARGGIVDYVTVRQAPHDGCEDWPATWSRMAREQDLDAAVVEIGPWDVTDRKLDGTWTHIGEPDYDEYLLSEMNRAVDALSSSGAVVIWLTSPHIEFGRGQQGVPHDHPINDPARMDRLNELIREVDAERDEMVVIDLVAYLRSLPGDEMDASLRPDGVHFSEEASTDLADWLGPAIIAEVRKAHAG